MSKRSTAMVRSEDDNKEQIERVPDEVLPLMLRYLPTAQKLRARLVSKTWRMMIDEHVPFDILLNDETFAFVRKRFSTNHIVRKLEIRNYTNQTIPITNLTNLKNLVIGNNVNETAVSRLLTESKNLNILKVNLNVMHSSSSDDIEVLSYPALDSIKYLIVGYDETHDPNTQLWNRLLSYEMPRLETLRISLKKATRHQHEFFTLASIKPTLTEFVFSQGCILDSPGTVIPVNPLDPNLSSALRNLNLKIIELELCEKDEEPLKSLLHSQRLEKLKLCINCGSQKGFKIFTIYPAITNNPETLHTIALELDPQMNSLVDLKVFSHVKTLRHLILKAPNEQIHNKNKHTQRPRIMNCNTIITSSLRSLFIIGFKFLKTDIQQIINKITELDLIKIKFGREDDSVWKHFVTSVKQINKHLQINTTVGFIQADKHDIGLILVPRTGTQRISMKSTLNRLKSQL